jgi:transglutaminase-like putative cysteine protease
VKLAICHITKYSYQEPVVDSINEIRLSPISADGQACEYHSITIEPSAPLFSYEDYFGNRVHAFSVDMPHQELSIMTQSVVTTSIEVQKPSSDLGQQERSGILHAKAFRDHHIDLLLPSRRAPLTEGVTDYARKIELPEKEPYFIADAIAKQIHADFQYDPDATHVQTTIQEMLSIRRGVCQDFAHLMIAICRFKGLPARYVSGYHFIGDLQVGAHEFQQASHAWVEVFIPGMGWCGFDPTNNAPVNGRYVKLGHGRDYEDITPVKGVYRGTPVQKMSVTVDVQKLSD